MPEQDNKGEPGVEDGPFLEEDESGAFHVVDEMIRPAEGSSDQKIVTLQNELEKAKQEAKKNQEQCLYLRADFDNYKKRVQREQIEQTKFANERLIKEMLVILDDLERAVLHAVETEDSSKVLEGLGLIIKQFLALLGKFGVAPIDSLNQPFDPGAHQAVGTVERLEGADNEVVQEVQRGYRLHDRVIRPAMVWVSKKKEDGEAASHL